MFRKIGLIMGSVLLMAGIYYAAIQYWLWKWESPHEPLPADTFQYADNRPLTDEHDQLASHFFETMKSTALDLQTVSISGAVSIHGRPTWAGTIGLASIAPLRPATTKNQYRIGSVSKPLTSVTLMRMAEQGSIDLDADISRYLPDLPGQTIPITPRQLASHMAGIRHYTFDLSQFPPTDFYSNKHYDDVDDAVEHFLYDELLFDPGQGFSYSTHGYTLLSAVMQAAAGKPFLQLVNDLVLAPLAMTSTIPEDRTRQLPQLVEFYTSGNGLYGHTPVVDLSNKWAGGGFIATPIDLVKLGEAVLGDHLLSSDSKAAMFKVQPMSDGSDNSQFYTLGWRRHETVNIFDEDRPVEVIHHGGASTGAAAFLLLVPSHHVSIAFASNGRSDDTRIELQRLAYKIARQCIEYLETT